MERLKEIEEAAKKLHDEFPTNWTYHAPDHFEKLYFHFITILSLCRSTEKERERLSKLLIEARMKIVKYRKGIEELIAYGMPKHIEEGLQELLEE